MAALLLRFLDDDDGTGKLVARAEAHGFSGEGGAYFGKQQLEEFATELASFPLAGRPSIAGGFFAKDGSGRLDQELLAIECYAVDAQGRLGIQVRIASEVWPSTRPDSRHSVALEMITSYEALRHFSRNFSALVHGVVDEAVLEAERERRRSPARSRRRDPTHPPP